MAELETGERWPSRTSILSGILVLAGFLLASVNWWFILLAGAGTFGPGILRELGWLNDQDEFQRQIAFRAGYHAFLITGSLAFLLVAYLRSTERSLGDPEEIATLLMVILWFTWFLSSLFEYWGPQKAVFRILVVFGIGWLVFTVASNVGREWTGWPALLMHMLLTLPFFALAWTSYRWPRITGLLLLVACICFAQLFGVFRGSNLGIANRMITYVLFIGPLLASGTALLVVKMNDLQMG